MAEQLILDLPHRVAMGRADFLVSDANAEAVAGIDDWQAWPQGRAVLVGPEASGKSHLAHVWAELAGAEVITAVDLDEAALDRLLDAPALVIEDIDRTGPAPEIETRLFHLLNAMVGAGSPVLLTARVRPNMLPITLPDLASRIAQARLMTLTAPDDALLAAVMVKLAKDRGMTLTPAMLTYALPRFERSFAAAQELIDRLNTLSLIRKQKPNRAHLKLLFEQGAGSPTPDA